MLNWLAPMLWSPGDTKWIGNIRRVSAARRRLIRPRPDLQRRPESDVLGDRSWLHSLPDYRNYSLDGKARTFGAIAVAISYVLHDISAIIMLGGNFHPHLSEHDRRARNFSSHDARRGKRSVGVDIPSGMVQESTGRDPR